MNFKISNNIKLVSLPSTLCKELMEQFTLPNPKHLDAVKFKKRIFNIPRNLQFYAQVPGGLILPRGAGGEIIKLAYNFGEVTISDERLSLLEMDFQFKGKLRPYQLQAVDSVQVKDFGILEAGTGAGKTVMAIALIAARKQPTLILVHTKELLYQWRDRIKTFLDLEAGLIGAGSFEIKPVTVAIVNTAKKHLDTLPQHFGHLVVDECHRVPSTLFTETVTSFACKYMLGLSATPYRRDGLGKLIGWYLGKHRVTVNMAALHAVGAILHPEIINRPTTFKYAYKDDYQKMVTALVEDRSRNSLIADDIHKQVAKGGLALVVSDRVDHLKELAARSHTPHCLLTGKTSPKKRQEIVRSLSGGDTTVLFSTLSLIGEGFDCPAMDSLFLTTPIKFEGRLKQVVGRVLRPAEGKTPLVYDYQDINVGLLAHQAKCRQRIFAEM